ncbi:AraC family transcriptional regulator [Leptospira langatensis]|uniref:AraC family transcriptional regulator n=1 Tax=Leptospira langatensis TaxID=2484983 RepID=A0A5F1ZX45_9LEPT|nr:helix-turn-helix domain-containing protein [Leptospira langatensis]TGJ98345.1 AraC family transcriptional regulator [Leptospira langatensis]TGL43258.1 AraC family transcriptional regulator [Leptospira langatensis]
MLIFIPELLNKFADFFHLAGIVICLLIGLERLSQARRQTRNLQYAAVFISVGSFQLLAKIIGFEARIGDQNTIPETVHINIYFGILIFSCLMLRVLIRRSLGYPNHPKAILINFSHSLAIMLLLNFALRDNLQIILYCDQICLLISTFTLVETIVIYFRDGLSRVYLNACAIALLASICNILDLMGVMYSDPLLLKIADSIPSLLIIYFYFLAVNFPEVIEEEFVGHRISGIYGYAGSREIIQHYSDELQTSSSEKEDLNILYGIDLIQMENKIQKFIDEKVFLHEELRLQDFSAYVGVTLHQVSYYLNKYKKISYTDFINKLRIQEAYQKILQNANKNLIDIGLECGFNSDSSFRRACIRFTGLSPKKLKKEIWKHGAPIENKAKNTTKENKTEKLESNSQ